MIRRLKQKADRLLQLVRTASESRHAVEKHMRIANLQIETLRKEVGFLREELAEEGRQKRVIFICHNPSLWGKVRSIYHQLNDDERFEAMVIAVPHKHASYEEGRFRDGGMRECLDATKVPYQYGYDEETDEWLDLQSLRPDFVFFQTPYNLFPPSFLAPAVSIYAKVCYVPYVGILIYEGTVDELSQPEEFFRYISFSFMPTRDEAETLLIRCPSAMDRKRVFVTGTPMFDYIQEDQQAGKGAWRLTRESTRLRMLWTPRWNTRENNCHFFDYKDKLLDWVEKQEEVEMVFRPHSLCFSNFEKTGEFTADQCHALRKRYDELPNTSIDESGEYEDTFVNSDVLISDMSSMMAEYLVTGKPVIYTHRTDSFNDLGSELSKGFYWVKNFEELEETISMLLSGKDPLKETREKIVGKHFVLPENGAASQIKELLAGASRVG